MLRALTFRGSTKLHNINFNFHKTILILVILIGVISLSFASNVREVVIQSTGKIITEIVAKSGYWRDIQEAVNLAAASGAGIVRIPEGVYNFVNVGESWTGARVVIPAGVSVLGAPTQRYPNGSVVEWKTVLVMPWDMPGDKGYVPPHWFLITGDCDPSKPSRFSDIALIGYRHFNPSATGFYLGIRVEGVINFRIDHCRFKEIPDGIQVAVGNGAQPACGVIDHCRLENDYGIPDPYNQRTTGYGVCLYRYETATEWVTDIRDIAGKYTEYTVFIEDCYFTKWRHCVAANHGAHYVFRHNVIEHGWAYGELDIHHFAISPYVPGRLAEIYENRFINLDDWAASANLLIQLKAGSALVFNNYIETGSWGTANKYWYVVFASGGSNWNSAFDPDDIYVWNNTLTGTPAAIVGGSSAIENQTYFLYKPDWYTSYPYPHPLLT